MSEKVSVRVTGRQFRHDGEEYHTGDTLEVPERAISGWESRLERVDDDEVDEEDEDEEEEDGEDAADSDGDFEEGDGAGVDVDPHPSDLTVSELEDRIQDVDDPDLLQRIREAEEGADGRSGALDAIDSRRADIDEEEE